MPGIGAPVARGDAVLDGVVAGRVVEGDGARRLTLDRDSDRPGWLDRRGVQHRQADAIAAGRVDWDADRRLGLGPAEGVDRVALGIVEAAELDRVGGAIEREGPARRGAQRYGEEQPGEQCGEDAKGEQVARASPQQGGEVIGGGSSARARAGGTQRNRLSRAPLSCRRHRFSGMGVTCYPVNLLASLASLACCR